MCLDKKIGIVTVLYNSSRHINLFVDSLLVNKEFINKIIFIDNGSSDLESVLVSIKKIEGIIDFNIIKNNKNIGYSKAVNQGLHYFLNKNEEMIMVTNNDAQFKEKSLSVLIDDMLSSNADVVGIVTTNDNKNYSIGCYFDRNENDFIKIPLVNINDLNKELENKKVLETAYVHGGVILFNKTFFKKVGLYDEYLFFGGDENDFLYRIHNSKQEVKCFVSLRSYKYFDHLTHHDNRFKLLKAKMIIQGEIYVLMKNGFGVFSAKLWRKVVILFFELGGKNIIRFVVLTLLFIRAITYNTFYLLTKKCKGGNIIQYGK